jgi:hypothetical protein
LLTVAAWLLLACSALAADEPVPAKSLDGSWQGTIEETMSPEVLELIAGWIRERTK